jgi:hypothetical protein
MGVIINGGINVGSGGILISSPYIIPNDYIGPICVSGAEITAVNGTYTFFQYYTQNGYTRPNYTINPAPFVFYNIDNLTANGAYRIVEGFGDSNELYTGLTFPPPANPYLETSWTQYGGYPTTLITTIGPC